MNKPLLKELGIHILKLILVTAAVYAMFFFGGTILSIDIIKPDANRIATSALVGTIALLVALPIGMLLKKYFHRANMFNLLMGIVTLAFWLIVFFWPK